LGKNWEEERKRGKEELTIRARVEEPTAHEAAVGAVDLGRDAGGGQSGNEDGGEADHFDGLWVALEKLVFVCC
jgi:hypothetical protein